MPLLLPIALRIWLIGYSIACAALSSSAGNLTFDGQFVYQYDAWNRLIQVNAAGALPTNWNGQVLDASYLGTLICRYTYDGLGRLIVKEKPTSTAVDPPMQRKDLYYDGVRRVQETIYRGDLAPLTGEGGNDEGAIESEDPGEGNQTPTPVMYHWTDREYVYGPEYVDEFVAQFAETQPTTMYMVQDANYNVVALCNVNGGVIEQYSYDPYGTVNAVDSFATHAVNRVGHQGLFFERFDGSYTEPSIAANIAGLYYNRNRFYSPTLGRFITRDPNETGIPIMTAMAMNGEAGEILLRGFAGQTLYGDGMNLYLYLHSNPVSFRDPLGLQVDEFNDVMMDLYAQAGAAVDAALSFFNKGLNWFKFIGGALSSFIPGADISQSVYAYGSGSGSLGGVALSAAMELTGPIGDEAKLALRLVGKARSVKHLSRAANAASRFKDAWPSVNRFWQGGKSLTEYHWKKHAEPLGRSLEEYTTDAIEFFRANKHRADEAIIGGIDAPGVRQGLRIDGSPGGIFTADGKIVTFWY